MAHNVTVVQDAAELADRATAWFAEWACAAVAARGRFTVALAGGSTPAGLYRELARRTAPDHAGAGDQAAVSALNIPWPQTEIFFGDERFVPHDDPESNFRMARETLLEHVPVSPSHVHPMPTEGVQPAEGAAEYQRTLQRTFVGPDVAAGGWPIFDLILLGMGPDGHTASLFPGTDVIHERNLLVAAPWVAKFNTYRLTLTPPVLCAARHVVFLVTGANKAETLQNVLEGSFDPDQFPSQIVRPSSGTLHWLVDKAAASRLTG